MSASPVASAEKPRRLRAGDRLAAVSPSWGGPGAFPGRYAAGKRQLEETFGVEVVEMQHALASPEWVATHPLERARDLMEAFSNPSISGIVATIGGDDSIRLLPYLDLDLIARNPKVFLGFSDSTSVHLACHAAGIVSFYGPSIMAGFAENGGMHQFTVEGVRRALFHTEPIGTLTPNDEGWTAQHLDWGDAALQTQRRALLPAAPPRTLQGRGVAMGRLIGGCAEVLEMAKGTAWWPSPASWNGAILFYETSEDAPAPELVKYWMRNFAAAGTLAMLNGILLARPDPRGDETYQRRLETAITDVLAEENLGDLPVLSGLDFGHTQPMLTLPYGVLARIDCSAATLTIAQAGVM